MKIITCKKINDLSCLFQQTFFFQLRNIKTPYYIKEHHFFAPNSFSFRKKLYLCTILKRYEHAY